MNAYSTSKEEFSPAQYAKHLAYEMLGRARVQPLLILADEKIDTLRELGACTRMAYMNIHLEKNPEEAQKAIEEGKLVEVFELNGQSNDDLAKLLRQKIEDARESKGPAKPLVIILDEHNKTESIPAIKLDKYFVDVGFFTSH
jgi:hypothetical protein